MTFRATRPALAILACLAVGCKSVIGGTLGKGQFHWLLSGAVSVEGTGTAEYVQAAGLGGHEGVYISMHLGEDREDRRSPADTSVVIHSARRFRAGRWTVDSLHGSSRSDLPSAIIAIDGNLYSSDSGTVVIAKYGASMSGTFRLFLSRVTVGRSTEPGIVATGSFTIR